MFGLSKRERAEKALKSALGIFLPGNRELHKAILNRSDEDRLAILETIARGENPYRAGAFLVADYIRAGLEEMDEDRKQRLFIMISEHIFTKPPQMFTLAAHMVNALAVLEDGKKPLLPSGSAYAFLDRVAGAFSEQAGAKKKISNYLIEYAAEKAKREAAKT